MTKRLIAALGSVFLAMACDSPVPVPLPTAPTTVPQVTPTIVPQATGTAPQATDAFTTGPATVSGTSILPGQTVQGAVQGQDPVCFPNWDSSAHCRQYNLVMPADGKLVATLKISGPTRGIFDPELFLVAPSGSWDYAGEGWPERRTSVAAKSGLTYRLVIICYGPFPDEFELTTEVQP